MKGGLTMSFIVRTGNLAKAPTLREGDNGPYTYARVLVSDSVRQEDGTYLDGPVIGYDVSVNGQQAVELVNAAETSGNIRVMFAGTYRVTEYESEGSTYTKHEVRSAEVAVSLRGQAVSVSRSNSNA